MPVGSGEDSLGSVPAHAPNALDLAAVTALARAARDLVRVGLHDHARPLLEALAARLEAAHAATSGAPVVDLNAERTKRRT